MEPVAPLNPSRRLLMGPGPSDVSHAVLQSMTYPQLGHLDPEFLAIMDRVGQMLREVFRTKNRLTLPLSGTGSAGMEACLVNLIEPGDTVVVGIIGYFGNRMAEIAERCGARVVRVESEWGRVLPDPQFRETVLREKPRIVAFVHAETTTGVLQPVEPILAAAREVNALTVMDCVTSLGGVPVEIDAWGVDAAFSASQKCLGAPPGLSPVTFSERAMDAIARRKSKVRSWYLDVSLLGAYWGGERAYHHTAPITMNYAIHEALRLLLAEGLENRFARHRRNHEALVAGLQAMGLSLASQEGHRLPMLNAVLVPAGIDETMVRKRLLVDFGIEIGAGMGAFKGRIWRVGLMGASCLPNNVVLFLSAFEKTLKDLGFRVATGGAAVALDRLKRE